MDNPICKGYQIGKQSKASHKKLTQIGTSRPLELLHMDLAGPTRTKSLRGKRYFFIVVDDFSRFTWVPFLREKSEAFDEFMLMCKKMQTEKELTIKRIRSDHESEIENHKFSKWWDKMGIKHEFSTPKTPQKNVVAERKNRTLHDMTNVMLTNKGLAKRFWAETINTTYYVSNRVFLRPDTTKTPYEI